MTPWMSPMVVKAWNKVWPYARHERMRRNEPDYFEQAERLADQCAEWLLKHLPADMHRWRGDVGSDNERFNPS